MKTTAMVAFIAATLTGTTVTVTGPACGPDADGWYRVPLTTGDWLWLPWVSAAPQAGDTVVCPCGTTEVGSGHVRTPGPGLVQLPTDPDAVLARWAQWLSEAQTTPGGSLLPKQVPRSWQEVVHRGPGPRGIESPGLPWPWSWLVQAGPDGPGGATSRFTAVQKALQDTLVHRATALHESLVAAASTATVALCTWLGAGGLNSPLCRGLRPDPGLGSGSVPGPGYGSGYGSLSGPGSWSGSRVETLVRALEEAQARDVEADASDGELLTGATEPPVVQMLRRRPEVLLCVPGLRPPCRHAVFRALQYGPGRLARLAVREAFTELAGPDRVAVDERWLRATAAELYALWQPGSMPTDPDPVDVLVRRGVLVRVDPGRVTDAAVVAGSGAGSPTDLAEAAPGYPHPAVSLPTFESWVTHLVRNPGPGAAAGMRAWVEGVRRRDPKVRLHLPEQTRRRGPVPTLQVHHDTGPSSAAAWLATYVDRQWRQSGATGDATLAVPAGRVMTAGAEAATLVCKVVAHRVAVQSADAPNLVMTATAAGLQVVIWLGQRTQRVDPTFGTTTWMSADGWTWARLVRAWEGATAVVMVGDLQVLLTLENDD